MPGGRGRQHGTTIRARETGRRGAWLPGWGQPPSRRRLPNGGQLRARPRLLSQGASAPQGGDSYRAGGPPLSRGTASERGRCAASGPGAGPETGATPGAGTATGPRGDHRAEARLPSARTACNFRAGGGPRDEGASRGGDSYRTEGRTPSRGTASGSGAYPGWRKAPSWRRWLLGGGGTRGRSGLAAGAGQGRGWSRASRRFRSRSDGPGGSCRQDP